MTSPFLIVVFLVVSSATCVNITLITDENRRYTGSGAMMGGWGEALRAPMLAPDRSLWMVVDAGRDVVHNSALHYYQRPHGARDWALAASCPIPDRVQQNMGSIMRGGVIYSYGVNVDHNYVEECALTMASFAFRCSEVVATPPSSNYIGVAAGLDKSTRLVMWTTVGDDGADGRFAYTANYGDGWNGPFSFAAPFGATDVSYVRTDFVSSDAATLLAQGTVGVKPWRFRTFAMSLDLATSSFANITELRSANPTVSGSAPEDIIVDAYGGAHAVSHQTRGGGGVAYHYRRPKGAWNATPASVIADAYRARFFATDGCLHLAVGRTNAPLEVRSVRVAALSAGVPVDWGGVDVSVTPVNATGFETVSAIYVPREAYGGGGDDRALSTTTITAAGSYPEEDMNIWAFDMALVC